MSATNVTTFAQIATAIVRGQMGIMGKVAISLAGRVAGMSVTVDGDISITGDPQEVIGAIVKEYSAITGPLGVRMCHNSAKTILDANPEVTINAFVEAGIS